MKTIRVMDLLNKIANGEEVPKKIKYQFKTFELNDSGVYLRTDKVRGNDYGIRSLLGYVFTCDLNDEVEIIEEDKKIEKIGCLNYCENPVESILHKKIDELIDEVNSIKEQIK